MSNQEKPKGRSNPGTESAPNPAKIFIQWKSKNEAFSYYNKEKKEDVALPMPFTFIPLFVCATVKGYNHKKTKTYISNEVENLSTDVLTVYSYNSTNKEKKMEHKGLYADIKEDFDQNVKFTTSLYAAIKNKKGEMSLVNLQLNGAGLHHWFDFTKKTDIWKNAVMVKSTTDEKNGTVVYKAPVYETAKISEADDAAAGELQEEIKAYLTDYFRKNAGNSTSVTSKDDDEQDNGLNTKTEAKKETKKAKEEEAPNVDWDSSDLPF
jgi:hypothetical protein